MKNKKNKYPVKRIFFLVIVFSIASLILLFLIVPPQFKKELIGHKAESYLSHIVGEQKIKLAYYPPQYVSINQLSRDIPDALIASEDTRFYYHPGIDPISIARAFKEDLSCFCLAQGGSTITQQLARNVYLSPEKTLSRKVLESLIAIKIEVLYSKDEILEYFLNYVYFGDELYNNSEYKMPMYGIQKASRFYFNKSGSQLTLSESTFLIATLRNPQLYNPYLRFNNTKSRQELVLRLMLEQGYLTKSEYQSAISENITLIQHQTSNDYVLNNLYNRGTPILKIIDKS